jgi:hypothetical protein
MARLASAGQRIGYLLILTAIVAFVVGLIADFPNWTVVVVVASLIGATVTLAPAIVLGYAVKAADREDRERDQERAQRSSDTTP